MRRLALVQIDTVSVMARSHELVPYARLGPVGRGTVEKAYWGAPHRAFEYWGHEAAVIPMEEWAMFAARRRALAHAPWHPAEPALEAVRVQLRDRGPLTASDMGGAKEGGGQWWSWSKVKYAAEALFRRGEVVCVERRSFQRVYDLAERAIPSELLAADPSDDECLTRMVRIAGRCLGVATRNDLADYFRVKPKASVDTVVEAAGLVPVEVDGWGTPAWADPELLDRLRTGSLRGRHRTTLLSPFDPIIWDRARCERVFGFPYRIEIYVPPPKRVHGYFVMPLLHGGELIGRVDPKRAGRTLVVRRASFTDAAVRTAARTEAAVAGMAAALVEAARWVDCDAVEVEHLAQTELLRPLRAALLAGPPAALLAGPPASRARG
ncbi:MAG TPA: crosslink repair DNA glycosylase YcaQ family protein [Acidimicrobiales bacterium]|nr:crosslink repair DNA glycosylase YcaQ family protein [Acidimicrobiales bacterium]